MMPTRANQSPGPTAFGPSPSCFKWHLERNWHLLQKVCAQAHTLTRNTFPPLPYEFNATTNFPPRLRARIESYQKEIISLLNYRNTLYTSWQKSMSFLRELIVPEGNPRWEKEAWTGNEREDLLVRCSNFKGWFEWLDERLQTSDRNIKSLVVLATSYSIVIGGNGMVG